MVRLNCCRRPFTQDYFKIVMGFPTTGGAAPVEEEK